MDDDDVDDVDDDHDDFLEQTFGYGGAEACVGYDHLITGACDRPGAQPVCRIAVITNKSNKQINAKTNMKMS